MYSTTPQQSSQRTVRFDGLLIPDETNVIQQINAILFFAPVLLAMKTLFKQNRIYVMKLTMSIAEAVIDGLIKKIITDKWNYGRLWMVF